MASLGGGAVSRGGDAAPAATAQCAARVLTSEVVKGGGIRQWVQPLFAPRAIPGSGGERGQRGTSELGNMGAAPIRTNRWTTIARVAWACTRLELPR